MLQRLVERPRTRLGERERREQEYLDTATWFAIPPRRPPLAACRWRVEPAAFRRTSTSRTSISSAIWTALGGG
jgi:hypothetical protein